MKIFGTILLVCVLDAGMYAQKDWPAYAHNQAGQRYSPLTQINVGNVSQLKLAWQYGVDLNPATRALTATEAVPIMVGGLLYTPTVHHSIVALEPETGKEVWKYELDSKVGAPLRGVSYWPGDRENPPLILAGTSDGKLLALNAKTGNLFQKFGKDGAVDLRVGVAEKFPDATY